MYQQQNITKRQFFDFPDPVLWFTGDELDDSEMPATDRTFEIFTCSKFLLYVACILTKYLRRELSAHLANIFSILNLLPFIALRRNYEPETTPLKRNSVHITYLTIRKYWFKSIRNFISIFPTNSLLYNWNFVRYLSSSKNTISDLSE